jgi:hypothetical protein
VFAVYSSPCGSTIVNQWDSYPNPNPIIKMWRRDMKSSYFFPDHVTYVLVGSSSILLPTSYAFLSHQKNQYIDHLVPIFKLSWFPQLAGNLQNLHNKKINTR